MDKIFEAALSNDTRVIREFLKFGNVNITDKNGSSLLHYATRGNALEVAGLLLDNHINLNIKNTSGETPLFEAVSRGQLGFCKLLCRYNASSDVVNECGETIYFKAILKGRMDIIELLEENLKIDYEFTNDNGENALFYTLKVFNNDLFIDLANSYPKLLKARNFNNVNLLMMAIKYDNMEIFDYLFDKFLNIYECDYDFNNILFYAARYGRCDMMKKLLSKNPIINGKNKDGLNIFELAELNHHPTKVLLENYKDSYEYKLYTKTYPFHIAVIERNYDLLDYGNPNINKKDANGISILDYINYLKDPIILKMFKLLK